MENFFLIILGLLYPLCLQIQTRIMTNTITTLRRVMTTEAIKSPSFHLSYDEFVKSKSGAAELSSYRFRISIDLARNRILTKSYMQISRSTRVKDVASGRFSLTIGWMAAQAIMSAATLMILFMISVVWQKTYMLMNASNQRGMNMVIISTTGYLQSGILKTAYLKGLKSNWVGALSQKAILFRLSYSYLSVSRFITSRQSKVYASIFVSTISYFPKLSKVEHEIIGANVLIFYCKGILFFLMGYSILKLLKLIRLMYNLSLSSFFQVHELISFTYLSCLSIFSEIKYLKRSTSMWSNETVRSRLMKLKGAKNSLIPELLMISILNSFLII